MRNAFFGFYEKLVLVTLERTTVAIENPLVCLDIFSRLYGILVSQSGRVRCLDESARVSPTTGGRWTLGETAVSL